MDKFVKVFDLITELDLNCENPYIEFSVGLEPKPTMVKEIYDFIDENKNWRVVDINKEYPIDYPSRDKLKDALKKIFKGNKSNKLLDIHSWIFLEWQETNKYGYPTNVRRLISLKK